MDKHVESGSTPGEPGESTSAELSSAQDLARGTEASSPSPGMQRQRASMPGPTVQPDLEELESQISAAVERRFQKAKDLRLARLERQFAALKELVVLGRKAGQEAAGTLAAHTATGAESDGADPAVAESAAAEQPPSERPAPRASHVIQPSGGGLPPAADLRAEYEHRVGALRPGDVAGLLEVKREFRRKGLEVY